MQTGIYKMYSSQDLKVEVPKLEWKSHGRFLRGIDIWIGSGGIVGAYQKYKVGKDISGRKNSMCKGMEYLENTE